VSGALPGGPARAPAARSPRRAPRAARACRGRCSAGLDLDAGRRGARGGPRRRLRARDRTVAGRCAAAPAPLRLPRPLAAVARLITSASNPRLKLVRKLGARRQREQLGLFVCEGEDLVEAALESGWVRDVGLVDAERPPEVELPLAERVEPKLLASVSRLGHAPRVIAIFRARPPERERPGLGLELWQVRDPGNVGTLARAADAFGGYLALSDGCADPFGPKAL